MKPIHLNLAARPYRDYRPVYAVVVALSLLTAFLMLNNVETYYRYVHETKATRAEIAQVEEQGRLESQREEVSRTRLKSLDLSRLGDQTSFINAKLAERAFSWSRLLDELESVLANDVRVISVSPGFTEEGSIQLELHFEAKSADGMITTINRMNLDPQFADAFPSSETQDEQGGLYTFALTTKYLPETAAGSVRQTAGVIR